MVFLEVFNDLEAIENLRLMWSLIMKQKTVLACFKQRSDEFAGMCVNYVATKGDPFMKKVGERVSTFPEVS